jgi:hypothetical protein
MMATGATVERTIGDKLAEVLSVKDFGAKGDGTADDTAAIQATHDYVVSVGGGVVLFPPGNYRITRSITFNSVGVRLLIKGATAYASRIFIESATPSVVFDIGGSAFDSGSLTFENIYITGSVGAGAAKDGNTAFKLTNRGAVVFNRCGVDNNWIAFSFATSYAPVLDKCLITNCPGSGVYFPDSSSNKSIVRDCEIFTCGLGVGANGAGISIVGADANESPLIEGNEIGNCYIGILIENAVSLSILNNYIENSVGGNVFMAGANGPLVIEGNWFGASPDCVLQHVDGLRFTNNTLFNSNILVDNGGSGSAVNTMIGQNHLLGTATMTPAQSAVMDFQSPTKGVRFPNMTTAQKNAIASPGGGLVVFDGSLNKLCVWNGAAWQTITSA